MKSKIIKRFAGIMAFLMLATQISIPTYAATGACSGHDGVDCAAGAQTSGKVICKDGWLDSSVDYSSMKDECGTDYVDPTGAATTTTGTTNDVSTGGSGGDDSVSTGGSGGDDAVTATLSEEVDVENVVDVITEDLEDVTDAAGETLVDEAVEEVIESLENESESGAEDALEDLESDIQDAIDELTSDSSVDDKTKAKIMRKIAHLKAMYVRIKAKLLKKHTKLIGKVVRAKQMPKIYQIRWGNLTGQRPRCTGVTLKDLREALANQEIPEKCQNGTDKVEYSGKISVDKGELKVRKEVLFEQNDKVTDSSGSAIAFDSVIAGHWDGLIVEYTPDDDQDTKANITISIGDLDETYVGAEALGRKKIGNGHFIEIKHIAKVMPGLAKGIQNNLLKYKLKIQDKVTNLRGKLDRLRLMNKGGDGADELDDLLDEAGEYNFDDETATEVESAIADAVSDLTDGASSGDLDDAAGELKGKLMKLKAKAKNKKFLKKMIPFKDTDDDQWYTDYVSSVKNRGIISGYKDAAGNELGEYRPGNNITVAEILKIGLETAGKGKAKGKLPNMVAAMNHWAKEYVANAEQLSLDLVEGDVDLNRPATRAEVVRMMLEALGIEPDEVSSTSFSDLPKLHKHADFVEYAKDLGIVSGDAGKTTFRPDAPVNRAEAAKIADQILGVIIGGWDSIGGDEPWE